MSIPSAMSVGRGKLLEVVGRYGLGRGTSGIDLHTCAALLLIMLYSYLHVKIEGGETTSMLCPAYGCYKFIPMVGL